MKRLARDFKVETDDEEDEGDDEPELIGEAPAKDPALRTASVEELEERLKPLQQAKVAKEAEAAKEKNKQKRWSWLELFRERRRAKRHLKNRGSMTRVSC